MSGTKLKQHFALNSEGEIVSIEDAIKRGGDYYCPYCNERLNIRWENNENTPNFAHPIYSRRKCSYTRYLHALAEIKISDWINNSDKIIIQPEAGLWNVCENVNKCRSLLKNERCVSPEAYQKVNADFNLKQWYDNAEIEASYTKDGQEYVADILCPSKIPGNDPLFIEIYITQVCKEEKKNSGIKIVEIKIEKEQDIDNIINGKVPIKDNGHYKTKLSQKFIDSTINFYGFYPKPQIEPSIKQLRGFKFVVSDKGRWDFHPVRCSTTLSRKGVYEITLMENNNWSALIARAIEQGYHVQQRIMCKYFQSSGGMCKIAQSCNLKERCRDNKAPCKYYIFEEQMYKINLDEFYRLQASGKILEEWKITI